jgi:hypothetical protein
MFYVVKVNQFSGSANRPATADKNGFAPILLSAHNGTLPTNARVISGTVAHRAGLEVGKNYAVKVTLTGVDAEYGDQFQYEVVGELTTMEVITKLKEFGQGVVQRAAGVGTPTPESVPAGTPAEEKF